MRGRLYVCPETESIAIGRMPLGPWSFSRDTVLCSPPITLSLLAVGAALHKVVTSQLPSSELSGLATIRRIGLFGPLVSDLLFLGLSLRGSRLSPLSPPLQRCLDSKL